MGGLDPIGRGVDWVVDGLTSPEAGVVLAFALGWMFCLSGVLKLRQPRQAALAMSDFGLTRIPRRWQGQAAGGAELALGLWLVTGIAPVAAAVAATAVLAFFVAIIARALRRDESFACFCFGEADDELGWMTLARTSALAALCAGLAVFVAVEGTSVGLSSSGQVLAEATAAGICVVVLVLLGKARTLVRWNQDVVKAFQSISRQAEDVS